MIPQYEDFIKKVCSKYRDIIKINSSLANFYYDFGKYLNIYLENSNATITKDKLYAKIEDDFKGRQIPIKRKQIIQSVEFYNKYKTRLADFNRFYILSTGKCNYEQNSDYNYFILPFSHYTILMKIDSNIQRTELEIEAIKNRWSCRRLDHIIEKLI